MILKLILLLVLTYPLNILSGLFSAILLRILEKVVLSSKWSSYLFVKRQLRDKALLDKNKEFVKINNNIWLKIEDVILGLFRGSILATSILFITSFFDSLYLNEFYFIIIIGQLFYILRSWSLKIYFSDEIFIWIGDIPGSIIILLIYSII